VKMRKRGGLRAEIADEDVLWRGGAGNASYLAEESLNKGGPGVSRVRVRDRVVTGAPLHLSQHLRIGRED